MKISKEEKAKRIVEWQGSGKSAWTYAKENGIVPQTFTRWVKQEKKNGSGFVEIPERIKPKQEQAQEILIEKGDIKIHTSLSVWARGSRIIMEGLRAAL